MDQNIDKQKMNFKNGRGTGYSYFSLYKASQVYLTGNLYYFEYEISRKYNMLEDTFLFRRRNYRYLSANKTESYFEGTYHPLQSMR
jgi:hypothetical protein